MALQVDWDSKVCIYSGNCVKTLPEVFRVEHGKFVIDPAAASEERVKAAVAACPSKALKIRAQWTNTFGSIEASVCVRRKERLGRVLPGG